MHNIKNYARNIPLGIIFFIPIVVLTGWFINNPYLTSVLPQFKPMNPDTAICFLLIGMYFLTEKVRTTKWVRDTAFYAAVVVCILVGGLMSLKYLFGIDLSIDQIFFRNELGAYRMSPLTAGNFVLFGIALYGARKNFRLVSSMLSFIVIAVGIYAFAAYIYNFIGVYEKSIYNPVAIHTAFLFIVVGAYAISIEGETGLLAPHRWRFMTDWFQNLRITYKFLIGFGGVVILMTLFTVYALNSFHQISAIYARQDRSVQAGEVAQELDTQVIQSRLDFEKFLVSRDPSYAAGVTTTRANVANSRNSLRALTDLPQTIALLNVYEAGLPARVALADEIIPKVIAGDKPESYAGLLTKRDALIVQSRGYLEQIVALQRASVVSSLKQADSQVRVIAANLALLGLLVLTLMILLSFAIARSIIVPVIMLKKQAELLTEGDFTARSNILANDDLGVLAATVNRMAESLGLRTRELQQAKAQDDAILSSIGDAVFAIDTKKRLILINPVAEDLAGIPKGTALGKPYDKFLKFAYEESEKPNATFVKSALAGKKASMENHTVLIAADGKKIPVADSASPLVDENGKVVGAVVVFRDVTHEHAIDQAKNEFVSLASHQLRTPLTSIKWYAELLLDSDGDALTDAQREYATEIELAMVRMNDLVASLLDVSRLDLGTFIIEPIPSDVVQELQNAVHEQEQTFLAKKQTLTFMHPEKLPLLPVDQKLLHIIAQNLLSNAHKYTQEGGTVALRLEHTDQGDYKIICADNGYGIPEAQQGSVFKKLFRADNIRTLDVEGTGLGLYIIKTIVDAAGCSIDFTSAAGKGTTFTITMPATGMRAKAGTKGLSGSDAV